MYFSFGENRRFYENDFNIKVPEEHLEFAVTITNYSTSITSLSEQGDFKLELTKKARWLG